MPEIKKLDSLLEITEHMPLKKGFIEIKPETDITVKQAIDYIASLFTNNICDSERQLCILGFGPVNNGNWDTEPNNSTWHPDETYIPPGKKGNTSSNPDGLTWGEILDKHGIDGITFKDGEPDFSKVSKGTVEIEPFTDCRSDNFDEADIELAKQKNCIPEEVGKWRKENNYTWHECQDMKTMQKVPHEVHANISHSGGISEIKKGNGA